MYDSAEMNCEEAFALVNFLAQDIGPKRQRSFAANQLLRIVLQGTLRLRCYSVLRDAPMFLALAFTPLRALFLLMLSFT